MIRKRKQPRPARPVWAAPQYSIMQPEVRDWQNRTWATGGSPWLALAIQVQLLTMPCTTTTRRSA